MSIWNLPALAVGESSSKPLCVDNGAMAGIMKAEDVAVYDIT